MAFMSHTIKISDETYEFVASEAARNGVDPAVWVEQKLKSGKKKKVSERAKLKAWKNYIGAFDSSQTDAMDDIDKKLPTSKRLDKLFGQILEEKMRKQGLKVGK
jgi:predicted transglutaminase-like protease